MTKKIIFIFILILIPLASANLRVNIDVQEFSFGEEVFFDYQIVSDSSLSIEYTSYVICGDNPAPLASMEKLSLEANKGYSSKYIFGFIDDYYKSADCRASIIIFSPFYREFSKNFSIITDPSFSLDFNLQKQAPRGGFAEFFFGDKEVEKSKTFLKNEKFYFDYSSDVSGLSISGILKYPDGQTKRISKFPSSLELTQVGTYELEITASKSGYKTLTKKEKFAVMDDNADIEYETVNPVTGIMGISGRAVDDGDFNIKNYSIIGIILGLVLIIAIILFILRKRKG